MPKVYNLTWACAYYRKHEATKIYCNCGEIEFPDKKTTSGYAMEYCASANNWCNCTLAKAWNKHYEEDTNEQSRADKKIRNTIKILTKQK